jgi:hypothetical protein
MAAMVAAVEMSFSLSIRALPPCLIFITAHIALRHQADMVKVDIKMARKGKI